MKRSTIFAALMLVTAPATSFAATVYPGCAVPTLKSGHRTFYVDPAKGSSKGDGSSAKPWRTLSEVVGANLISTQGHNFRVWGKGDASLIDVNPKAPIKAGDVIMLMSGSHGSVSLSNMYNKDFITVMAAPGQTPTLDRLLLASAGKWSFQGLRVIGQKPSNYGSRIDGLVSIGYQEWLGSTSDVVLDQMTLATTLDTSGWTAQQWVSLPYAYAVYIPATATCLSITDSSMLNNFGGIAIGGSKTLVQGNRIEKMTNDGIDVYNSNVTIKSNLIKDGANNTSSSAHADGIQGWSPKVNGKEVSNTNVVIDSNTLIKTGPTNVSYMQGIAIFNGIWDNLLVTNNMVVSNAFHGITVAGIKSGSVVNNTVLRGEASTGTWMMVKSANGPVIVRNNIVPALIPSGPGLVDDHNVVATKGNYSSSDKYDPNIMSNFVTFNNATQTYDLRPKSNSSAIAFGTASSAPIVDITGKRRLPTITAGAYN